MSERHLAPGRPKSEAASTALKEAALQLVRENGYSNVSISQIIAMAGVSRQTLYARWPTKAELVLDAFLELAHARTTPPDLAGDTPRDKLLADFLGEIFDHINEDGDSLRSLIAAAQADPGFRDVFWSRFVSPRAEIVRRLLADAQLRGELDASRDIDLLSSFIHGAFWYRLLNGRPLGNELTTAIVDEIFRR